MKSSDFESLKDRFFNQEMRALLAYIFFVLGSLGSYLGLLLFLACRSYCWIPITGP